VDTAVAAAVLAAGKGTRMHSAAPKVLHSVGGRPLIGHVMAGLDALDVERRVVVVGPGMEAVTRAVAPVPAVVQAAQGGTGEAVRIARDAIGDHDGVILVAYGDTPLVRPQTYAGLCDMISDDGAAVAVLGFRPPEAGAYGRLVLDADGRLERIVEARDASDAERAIDLCNGGLMAVRSDVLWPLLDAVGNDNAKGEYYLTDIVGLARERDLACAVSEIADPLELVGVNDRAELAVAEAVFQTRARAMAMAGGATLVDPSTVYFSHDTRIGRDVLIEPHVIFGTGVTIADNVQVRAFCRIEGAIIGAEAIIGPFARIRPETVVGREARIGNFVEVKNATFDAAAKVSHLSYIGDARIGEDVNIGAGVITCNFDGVDKHRTTVEDGAFVGSNSALVAPVVIGAGAVIGAGSVVTEDVPPDALSVGRAPQKTASGGGRRMRERRVPNGAPAKDET